MKKLSLATGIFLFLLFFPKSVFAQSMNIPDEKPVKAKVLDVLGESTKKIEGLETDSYYTTQKVKIKILSGEDKDKEFTVNYGGQFVLSETQKVEKGQAVVVKRIMGPSGLEYQIIDKYRINQLVFIALIFFVLVIMLSRWKGLGSFLGMILSLAVIVKFIIPQILAGHDPLLVSIAGSIFILVTTIYLAHGFSKQTSIAVISTAITLILTGLLAVISVNLTSLTGLAGEDASSLQFGPTASIDFKGLLLGGMIIGFLGALDDVTTGLSATVFELKKVNPKLKTKQLISSSLNVGREHISSLVNTLVLAYAGASLPLFLFIVLNPQGYPMWFIINSEFIAEEIVRTLVGSIGLLFSVPITAILAALVVENIKGKK